MTLRRAAGRFGVSVATAHRWWHRWLDAGSDELASGVWLFDRSSRPRRSPRLLDAIEQERICEARRHTGWGPRLVAGQTGHPHSTVWKVLHRHGLSRRPRQPRETPRRYEWPCPGDLRAFWTSFRHWLPMLPAARRGLHTNGLSPPNGRSTPVIHKLGDEVLHCVVVPGLGGGRTSHRATGTSPSTALRFSAR